MTCETNSPRFYSTHEGKRGGGPLSRILRKKDVSADEVNTFLMLVCWIRSVLNSVRDQLGDRYESDDADACD